MPTTNFAIGNAAIAISGFTQAPAAFGGHNPKRFRPSAQLDTVATGTACTISCFLADGAQLTFSVDGAAYAAIAPGTYNVWITFTLFTGLADTAHTVSIKATAAGSSGYLDVDNALQVTGAAPALAFPSGFGTQYALETAGVTNFVLPEGMHYYAPDGTNYARYAGRALDSSYTFRATCDTIKVFLFCNGLGNLRLTIDGVDSGGLVAFPGGSVWNWVTVATGLDSAAEHLYQIRHVNQANVEMQAYSVMLLGGTGMNTGALIPPRRTFAAIGDSITLGVIVLANVDSTAGFVRQAQLLRPVSVANFGIGGKLAADMPAQITNLNLLTPVADWVSMLVGTNDVSAATATATFQTTYQSNITSILSGNASLRRLLCLGILPRTDGFASGVATYNAAIQAAVAAAGDPKALFVDTSGWLNTGTDLQGDGLHPNAAGMLKIAKRLVAYLGSQGHRAGSLGVMQ